MFHTALSRVNILHKKEKYCRNYAGYWYIKVQVKKDRKIVVIKVQVKKDRRNIVLKTLVKGIGKYIIANPGQRTG